jgi:myo-inositol 2-dehydrogenase / D-chiro-inositol 1-dehydrogenase
MSTMNTRTNSPLNSALTSSAQTRRQFIKTSSAAVGTALAAPYVLRGQAHDISAADVIKVGLIGCGGRGTGAASQAMKADKGTVLTAMADVFPDRLESSHQTLQKALPDKIKVEPDHRFIGLDAYQKLLDSGIDVVILTTPPGFRPIHLKAAVEANKHVFTEKPMAVDAPGLRSVMESVKVAKAKNLAMVAGFCWRYNPAERQIFERVHNGEIGDIRALYTCYNTGFLWSHPRKPGWTDLEYQLRNWLYYTWLSGDHITEQAIHSLDKMAWAMKDVPPVRCYAHGGRQVRTDPAFGNIFDHFSVVYEYPNDVKGYHFSRQQAGCFNDNSDQFFGTKGSAYIKAFGPLHITGENPWNLRSRTGLEDMYQVEHNEMYQSIRAGKPNNDGVRMARSTLLALMGRMAAYTGQMITWDEALDSQEKLMPDKLDWNAPMPVAPVALPGLTKFV